MGLLPYSPLANGLLTGKYERGLTPGTDTRIGNLSEDVQQRNLSDRTFNRIAALKEFAGDHNHSLLELAMAWLLAFSTVSSVIAGATRPEQVAANAAAVSWHLTVKEADDVRRIVAAVAS